MGGGGADSGQAANGGGGLWGAVTSWGNDFWDAADPAQLGSGGVVGAGPGEVSAEAKSWGDKLKEGLARRAAGGLPGYGELWQIGADGVEVTPAGKIVAAAVVVGLGMLLLGGGKRGRW